MSLYSKNITKKLTRGALLSTVVITAVLSSIVFLNELHSHKIVRISDSILLLKFFVLSMIPVILHITPVSVCCTTLYVIHITEMDRELSIWRAAGMSQYQIAKPFIRFSIFISLLLLLLSMFILPLAEKELRVSFDSLTSDSSIASLLEEKSFNRISRNTTLYTEQNSDNQLQGVLVHTKEQDGSSSIIIAEKATLVTENQLTLFKLYNGSRYSKHYDSNQTLFFRTLTLDMKSSNSDGTHRDLNSENYKTAYQLLRSPKLEGIKSLVVRTCWPMTVIAFSVLGSSILISSNFSRKTSLKPLIHSFVYAMLLSIPFFLLKKKISQNLSYSVLFYAIFALCIFMSLKILGGKIKLIYTPKVPKK